EKPEKEQFQVVNKTTLTVRAECCLWFAWAPLDFEGPEPHKEGEASRPVWVGLLPETTHVSVSVTSEGEWQHGGQAIEKTDAHGRTDAEGTKSLGDLRYQSDYRASLVADTPARLNCLMVIAGNESGPIFPNEAIPVGLGGTIAIGDVGVEGRLLFFGMHDAYQWNNNKGIMEVEVEERRII
ncbi:MAG: hypothetical protein ACI9HK_002869, partial [Pirellulaceae bacterium]